MDVLSLPPPSADKASWRAWARGERGRCPLTPADSQRLCAGLLAFLEDRGLTGGVLAYRALPGEPDLSALADQLPLYTTRAVFRPQPHLTLHPWHTASERSRFGVLQPPAGTSQVPREAVSAAVLPGLAFDLGGRRLGYGGGFYDRLLAGWTVPTIGMTPAGLLVPQLPAEPHDVPMEFIATQDGVRAAQPE